MGLRHFSTGLTVLGVVSAASGRQLEYYAHWRTDTAETNGSGPVWAASPDGGPWIGLVEAFMPGYPYPLARVSQNSTLASDRITVNGQFNLYPPALVGQGFASGNIHLEAQFQVSEPRFFQLSGYIGANNPSGASPQPRSVQVSGPGVSISLQDPGSFLRTGMLEANIPYSIVIDVGSYATLNSNSNAIYGFQTMLAVQTCYANCDFSTTVPILNILDFMCFLNRYAAGDPNANCDNSTTPPVLNVLDFACFLNRYSAGCP